MTRGLRRQSHPDGLAQRQIDSLRAQPCRSRFASEPSYLDFVELSTKD